MLSFDEACEAVRANSEQHHLILLLRIYASLSIDEIATELGCSSRTIERQWKFIKATLHAHLFPTERSPIP
jgi:transcriptional antiterminator